MGYFTNIDLINFRNFEIFNHEFSKNCNVFFGKNGSGKTNLLESISMFSKGRGIKKDRLSNIIKTDQKNFMIKSNFNNNDVIYNLKSETYEKNDKIKKKLTVNNDYSIETLNNFYTFVPFLFFLPETERLFLSSPSIKKKSSKT